MSTRSISWELRWQVLKGDNLTTFMCWLPRDLGPSISWNPTACKRPAKRLLYLFVSYNSTTHFICNTAWESVQLMTILYLNYICYLPRHSTSPSPSNPVLHLHKKCAGRLQHSAFSTHLAATAGSSHSFMSGIGISY